MSVCDGGAGYIGGHMTLGCWTQGETVSFLTIFRPARLAVPERASLSSATPGRRPRRRLIVEHKIDRSGILRQRSLWPESSATRLATISTTRLTRDPD